MIRGIKIDDCDLNVSSEVFDPKPRIYGDVDIDDKERKLLDLPPKFGLLEKVNPTNCVINVEKCLNQIRWRKNIGKEEERKFMYDCEKKEIDINNLKATDLHFNTNVKMPDPINFEEEIKFQNF